MTVYNSTAFNNGTVSGVNFRFDESFPHVLKNNVSLSGTVNINAAVASDHNTWNSGLAASLSDFISTVDPATDGVFHPVGTGGDRDSSTSPVFPVVPARQADGSLPISSFLQLKAGDHLADAGVTSFVDTTGTSVTLSSNSKLLNFTGVTIQLAGYFGASPRLGRFGNESLSAG